MLDRSQAGDTLVEVLIATAILSMAVVGALSAMSFGQGIALNAVERTEVQGLMNSQLSYLRYARDMKIQDKTSPLWDEILTKSSSDAIPAAACSGNRPTYRNNMFYIKEFSGATAPAVNDYPTLGGGVPKSPSGFPSSGDGIWIEAKPGGASPTGYIDFYVKACWAPTSGTTMQESRSVMRLYVPA